MWKKEYDILISNFMGVDIIDIRGDMYHISTEGHRIAVEYYENWNWMLFLVVICTAEIGALSNANIESISDALLIGLIPGLVFGLPLAILTRKI
jgi:hypothetical protein